MLQHNYYLTRWKQTCAPLVAWAMCVIGRSATKMHQTCILRDTFWIIIDASQISGWHSQNPTREEGSSSWHQCTAPWNADVSAGAGRRKSSVHRSAVFNEELWFFYLCLEGDTGASQSAPLSTFQRSVGTNPQAAAHPAFLSRGSFQQLYNMSAKRKQEGKGKWSYEVKTKKIKIPGSCGVAVAAGGGSSLFGESAA